MISERQTVVFTFSILTIMAFTGVNVVGTYAPPNEGDIQLVDLNVSGEEKSITKNNIYVEEGDKITPYVEDKKSDKWVNIESLSSDPEIKIINNTVYTDTPNCEISNNSEYQKLDYSSNNYVLERYKVEYAGHNTWINLYCTGN